MDNELMILIRKQLTQSLPKYKRIGIIGAVMVATTVARHTVLQGSLSQRIPVEQQFFVLIF